MQQEEAVIKLRDAAADGGEYVVDTASRRLTGQIIGTPRLTADGHVDFRLNAQGRERLILRERILRVAPVHGGPDG